MLLHLHQCQLNFLVDFFGRKNPLNDHFPNNCHDSEGSKSFTEKSKDHACHSITQEALLPYFQVSIDFKKLMQLRVHLRLGFKACFFDKLFF